MDARELYLDLLKKTLTANIYADEPDVDDANVYRYLKGFLDHYIRGHAHTMVPLARLDNVQACAADVLERGIPGDFIETGVWRGGTTIFLRGILEAFGDTKRRVWVADSFQGLPEPDAERFPEEARAHASKTMVENYKHFAVSADTVRENFRRYGLLDERVVFLEGWFKDTLPGAQTGPLALARLDGDYFESTRDALVSLFPRVSVGGYVIIDDYGEDTWTQCRRAVDEFRAANGITDPLMRVDSKCWFWKRTA